MTNARFTLSAVLTFCGLFFAGCQLPPRVWHMDARKQGETVELCLSNEVTCPQPNGVSPADISVYRYDSTYDNELIWEASPPDPDTNQKISGIVTYGVPPKGWSNRMTPPALVCGKAYL